MKNIFKASEIRLISTIVALILVLPLPLKGLTGFLIWFSPFIMLNSAIVLRSFVWLNLISSFVLILVTLRKRWFCRYMCPVGWSCDIVSGMNRKMRGRTDKLPESGKYLAIISLASAVAGIPLLVFLDPLAIFNGFFTIMAGEITVLKVVASSGFIFLLVLNFFLPGIWCRKICPLGGLQDLSHELKSFILDPGSKKKHFTGKYSPARRYILASIGGLAAGFAIPVELKKKSDIYIRPPASVERTLFNSLCSRCGNCIKACPTGIIAGQTTLGDFTSFMTPKITYKQGYCLENCNLCGQVCPTGAIFQFDISAKNKIYMGIAVIDLQNCLLTHNRECNRCKVSCRYDAIEFISGENILNMRPVVDKIKCVGCGACEVICPENCIVIQPVSRQNILLQN